MTRRVIAIDTETWLIRPGLLAPRMVCLQWATSDGDVGMCHRANAHDRLKAWLLSDAVIVGHNLSYDAAVIGAQFPDLLPLIFDKYDRDGFVDSQTREQLVMIARGTFRASPGPDGDLVTVKYSLDECCARHFGRRLNKEGWRLFYRVFDEAIDISMWPEVAARFQAAWRAGDRPEWATGVSDKDIEAMLAASPDEPVRYALEDATTTLALYESQETHFGHPLADQYRKARASFALHLSSCWGLYTDTQAVDKLETEMREEFEALKFELQIEGLIRADGTADTAVAKAKMVEYCAEENIPAIYTAKGAVSMGAEACARFDEDSVIGQYSRFLTLRKTISNDIAMLRAGCDVPIQPRYDWADTGRTRCSKPNIQAINRGAGIREAFRPRPGTVFIQGDYEGLELHTRAVWCLEKIGWSKLADDLNAGFDVHSVVGAEFLGMTYEDFKKGLKSDDADLKKRCKDARQAAKAYNFGVPGGLGVKKTIAYAKKNYGVDLTGSEVAQRKQQWLQRQPEMVEFFQSAAQATANPSGLADEESLFTARTRGSMRYSVLCNGRFQGLGADAACEGLWGVTKACYIEPASPLYGCRPVAFVHDEIIAECPEGPGMSAAAVELGRLMCEGADKYLHRVPTRVLPLIMRVWSKAAEPVYAEDGTLLPWSPR